MPHRPTAALVLSLAFLPGLAPAADDGLGLYFREDRLVESATRAPKPLSQVAENVTVVTAAEIEAMGAHTLGEVLDRVTGVFVQWFGVRHFGASPLVHVQGSGQTDIFVGASSDPHVTLLVDGVPLNLLTGGPAFEVVPVGIIERVEVLKGPGSSAWGSALGAVVNVVTKRAGGAAVPAGQVATAIGERSTLDNRAEVAGALGPVGYYLQGQTQQADWDDNGGGFSDRSAFAKAAARLGPKVTLTISGGGSRPEADTGPLASQLAAGQNEYRSAFGRASLDATPGPALAVHASAYRSRLRLTQPIQETATWDLDGDGIDDVFPGDLLWSTEGVHDRIGAQGRVSWAGRGHALVAGADYERGELDLTTVYGPAFGSPPPFAADPSLERVGIYVNDTATWGPLTATAGLRWDDTTRTDSFWSPSLGATVRLGGGTLLRGLVARGFTLPPLNFVTGVRGLMGGNPGLGLEKVWSYEVGAETTALPFLWCKASAFRHEVTDSIEWDSAAGHYANDYSVWRTGAEAEAETSAWRGLSLRFGAAYVKIEKPGRLRDQAQWQAKGGLSYRGWVKAQLLADYVWWDLGAGSREGAHDDMLLDLVLAKEFPLGGALAAELFGQVHNLTNGERSWDTDRGTAGRWVEAGARLRF